MSRKARMVQQSFLNRMLTLQRTALCKHNPTPPSRRCNSANLFAHITYCTTRPRAKCVSPCMNIPLPLSVDLLRRRRRLPPDRQVAGLPRPHFLELWHVASDLGGLEKTISYSARSSRTLAFHSCERRGKPASREVRIRIRHWKKDEAVEAVGVHKVFHFEGFGTSFLSQWWAGH